MKPALLIGITGVLLAAGWITGKRLAGGNHQALPPSPRIIAAVPNGKSAAGFSDRWKTGAAHPDKETRLLELESIFKDWAAVDPRAALEAVVKPNGQGEDTDLLARFLLARIRGPESKPVEAAAWLESLPSATIPPDQLANLERAVANAWLTQNPRKAADWLLARATPETRSSHLAALVSNWVLSSPNACGEWLRTLSPGPDTDPALEIFARQIVREDPESAFAWASRIAEPVRREQMMQSIIEKWRVVDPDAAAAAGKLPALTGSGK